jgi:RHS repeat-associated protein
VVWLNYSLAWGGSFDKLNNVHNLDGLDISADLLQPIRFQGQFFDSETNLHYNRFRYYDSDVGMFVSRDPIGLLGGSNVFSYAPNPIGWIDPLGLAGQGGAYMFQWKNGGKYIGKGLYDRFQASRAKRKNDKSGKPDCLLGEAWISTNGDNEMGKMVENRAMFLNGFVPGKGKAGVPAGFANSFMSGTKAYQNATSARQAEATRLAQELIAKFEADKLAKSLAKNNCIFK